MRMLARSTEHCQGLFVEGLSLGRPASSSTNQPLSCKFQAFSGIRMQRLVSVEQLFIIASAYRSNMKMAWQVQSQVSPLNAVLDPDSPVDLHQHVPVCSNQSRAYSSWLTRLGSSKEFVENGDSAVNPVQLLTTPSPIGLFSRSRRT